MKRFSLSILSLTLFCQVLAAQPANDWPWWRGPNKNNIANGPAPTEWSQSKNILWEAPVSGRGHSSPIVVGPHIFLATADEQKKTQSVVCHDRDSGKLRWTTKIHEGGFDGRFHAKNTRASATLASDGERVYGVFYNDGSVWATALALDGQKLWQEKVSGFTSHWGYSASPTVHKSSLIIAADNKGESTLAALDGATGKLRWRTKRPAAPTYASPIVLEVAGRLQLLICGADSVHSYDPDSGEELWSCKGTSTECVGTLVASKDLVFASGGYPKKETLGVRADGSGKVQWRIPQGDFVPSLLLHEGHLYTVLDNGVACCWNAETGAETWKTRLEGNFSASPILTGDCLYVSSESGVTFVFKANPMKFEPVAENRLGTAVFATPAICGGRIYLRAVQQVGAAKEERLFCIGVK